MTFCSVGVYKDDASEKEKLDLLSEMSVLKHLDPHPHVIRLYGCVTTEGELKVDTSLLSNVLLRTRLLSVSLSNVTSVCTSHIVKNASIYIAVNVTFKDKIDID